jgi:hypothetical protein
MTAQHRRAARREQQAADVLKTRRTKYRPRFQRAPDVTPVTLADGRVLSLEVKTRAKLPKWLRDAFAQAQRYLPGAIPVVVLSETGGAPLAVLPLDAFAGFAGLQPQKDNAQLVLGVRS